MPPLVVPEEENEELNGYAKGVAEGVAARVQTGPLNVVGGDTKEVVEGGTEGVAKGGNKGAPATILTEQVNVVEGGIEGEVEGGIEGGGGAVQTGHIQHQKNDITQRCTNKNNKVNFLYMLNILYDSSYRLIFTLSSLYEKLMGKGVQ